MATIKYKDIDGIWEKIPFLKGEDGKSVYEIWLEQGNTGTEQDFLDSLKGSDGKNGVDGKDGNDGTNGVDGKNGTNGTDGQDGYSPIATVTQTDTGAIITITDKNGTTTTNITNGKDGANGKDGNDYILTDDDKLAISKLVEVDVPTKVSELENDRNFTTKEYVDNLVGDIETLLGGI